MICRAEAMHPFYGARLACSDHRAGDYGCADAVRLRLRLARRRSARQPPPPCCGPAPRLGRRDGQPRRRARLQALPAARRRQPARVFVAFLDLFDDPAASTHGVCVAVDDAQLPVIDQRERNYDRIDVTDRVTPVRGTVWAYVGSAAGRRRLRRAREAQAAVVSRDYLERTRAAFAALGGAARADFEAVGRGRRPARVGPPALRELTFRRPSGRRSPRRSSIARCRWTSRRRRASARARSRRSTRAP